MIITNHEQSSAHLDSSNDLSSVPWACLEAVAIVRRSARFRAGKIHGSTDNQPRFVKGLTAIILQFQESTIASPPSLPHLRAPHSPQLASEAQQPVSLLPCWPLKARISLSQVLCLSLLNLEIGCSHPCSALPFLLHMSSYRHANSQSYGCWSCSLRMDLVPAAVQNTHRRVA